MLHALFATNFPWKQTIDNAFYTTQRWAKSMNHSDKKQIKLPVPRSKFKKNSIFCDGKEQLISLVSLVSYSARSRFPPHCTFHFKVLSPGHMPAGQWTYLDTVYFICICNCICICAQVFICLGGKFSRPYHVPLKHTFQSIYAKCSEK